MSNSDTIISSWNPGVSYTAGSLVTINDVTYVANWWTLGANPASNNGAKGTGQPWTIITTAPVATTSSAPAQAITTTQVTSAPSTNASKNIASWNSVVVYTQGMQVIQNGIIYQANWWTQGAEPSKNNGGSGTGQPWSVVATLNSNPVAPNAPTNLIASAKSSNDITLSWNPATINGSGTVTNYLIFKNGVQIGSSSTTSYAVSGLTPSTNYNFAVKAVDAAGASPLSGSLLVTTSSPLEKPNAPAHLTGTATSSSSISLIWDPATITDGGVITNYLIFKNGTQVGSTTNTSYVASGLNPSTNYQFAVEAVDAAGASPLSVAVSISTQAASASPGTLYGNVAAWKPDAIYTKGMTASENNIVYQANWWTQGADPLTHNGSLGTAQPWTVVGQLNTSPAAPNSPANLTAIATSSSSIALNWGAATISGSGTVSNYLVFENGAQVASTTNTYYTINGLNASTSYNFTVEALDATGASPQSNVASATTLNASQFKSRGIFVPYIDMTLYTNQTLAQISQASGVKQFTLAFLQSSGNGNLGWGGTGTLSNDAPAGISILQEIKDLRAIGGEVIISFGGAAGIDPAAAATSAAQLQSQYQSVIDRYGATRLDFDIEGAQVANQASIDRRDAALVGLKAANPKLQISFTLPVLSTGLDNNGLHVLQSAKIAGLTPDVLNIMAMDYGASIDNGGQMGLDAVNAALGTHAQLQQLGMNSTTVGITPMIGVNDINTEIFTLADAQQLVSFAQGQSWVSELSMWSIARDNGAGAGQTYASATSSGLAQSNYQFSQIFGQF